MKDDTKLEIEGLINRKIINFQYMELPQILKEFTKNEITPIIKDEIKRIFETVFGEEFIDDIIQRIIRKQLNMKSNIHIEEANKLTYMKVYDQTYKDKKKNE